MRSYYPSRKEWIVIGNGVNTDHNLYAKDALNKSRRIIVFNDGYPQISHTNRVVNGKSIQGSSPMCISGNLSTDTFNLALKTSHNSLKKLLSNSPSTGLSTIHTLTSMKTEIIHIKSMNLLPSIARKNNTPEEKNIPCHYHNWLGERRLAFSLMTKNTIFWPQWHLPSPAGKLIAEDPITLLKVLENEPGNVHLPIFLSKISISCWLNHLTLDILHSLEPMFHLSRTSRASTNWWLFDYEASIYMARVHLILAYCQQQILNS